MTSFLHLPLFWDTETIVKYWLDLIRLLKQVKHNDEVNSLKEIKQIFKSFSAIDNRELLKLPPDGWTDQIYHPVGYYFVLELQFTKKTGQFDYDGHNLYDLLRAWRNLYEHLGDETRITAGPEDPNYRFFLEFLKLQEKVREKFAENGVTYWNANFPEFLLFTFNIGYQFNEILNKIKFSKNLNRYFTPWRNEKSFTIPKSLQEFGIEFANWTEDQWTSYTKLWISTYTTSNEKTIHFLRYPEHGGPNLAQRELMTIEFSAESEAQRLEVTRQMISAEQEADSLISKQPCIMGSIHASTLEFLFQSTDICRRPITLCTEIISAALNSVLTNTNTEVIIFTNAGETTISTTLQHFAELWNIAFEKKEILWHNFNADCKSRLLALEMPIQSCAESKSSETVKLQSLYDMNPELFDKINGEKVLKLFYSETTNSSYFENKFSDTDNYYSRSFSQGSDIPLEENEFVETFHQSSNRSVFIISDIVGMGKTTSLVKLASLLIAKNHLVKYLSAKELVERLSELPVASRSKAFIEFWSRDILEQLVVEYCLHRRTTDISLLIDGFDEVHFNKDKDSLIKQIKEFLELGNATSVVKFIVTTRPTAFQKLEHEFESLQCFSIVNFDDDMAKAYIFTLWSKYFTSKKGIFNAIVKKCLLAFHQFGEFSYTPFACNVISVAFKKYAENQIVPAPEEMSPACDMYEIFLNLQVKDHISKHLQIPAVSNALSLNSNTIDYRGAVFRKIKRVILLQNGIDSMKIRFGQDDEVFKKFYFLRHCLQTDDTSNYDLLHTRFHDSAIDLALLDYYIAMFVFTISVCKKTDTSISKAFLFNSEMIDFIISKLFALEVDLSTETYNHNVVIQFLDGMLRPSYHHMAIFHFKIPKNIHLILFRALEQNYEYLFVSLLNSISSEIPIGLDSCWDELTQKNMAIKILHSAIRNKNIQVTKYLLTYVKVDVEKTFRGLTALQLAILPNIFDKNIVEALFCYGAILSIPLADKNTVKYMKELGCSGFITDKGYKSVFESFMLKCALYGHLSNT